MVLPRWPNVQGACVAPHNMKIQRRPASPTRRTQGGPCYPCQDTTAAGAALLRCAAREAHTAPAPGYKTPPAAASQNHTPTVYLCCPPLLALARCSSLGSRWEHTSLLELTRARVSVRGSCSSWHDTPITHPGTSCTHNLRHTLPASHGSWHTEH